MLHSLSISARESKTQHLAKNSCKPQRIVYSSTRTAVNSVRCDGDLGGRAKAQTPNPPDRKDAPQARQFGGFLLLRCLLKNLLREAKEHCQSQGLPDPGEAYSRQKSVAKQRGIQWEITFDEWWNLWSPYYRLRGRGTNGLCMAREGDSGAYKIGNVYLTTNLGNMKDGHATRSKKRRLDPCPPVKRQYWGRQHGKIADSSTRSRVAYVEHSPDYQPTPIDWSSGRIGMV